jgi:hypothetical protein
MKTKFVPSLVQSSCGVLSALVLALSGFSVRGAVTALPVITRVVETGGDNEATDTVVAKWTGITFTNGVSGEFLTPFTVPYFGEDVPAFTDRNHQWNGALTNLGIPSYLRGGEYVMIGNDNRDNAPFQVDITVSVPSFVYLLIDTRQGDADGANPPQSGLPIAQWTNMLWMRTNGFAPVLNGLNRTGNRTIPDEVGVDEGADGVGAGVAINSFCSVYFKIVAPGTFSLYQPDNAGQNMYGVVVKAANITETNLALSGVATNNGTGFGGLPGRANDGNTDGRFNNNSVSHSATNNIPNYLDIDLGGTKRIGAVYLWLRTDCCYDRNKDLQVVIYDSARRELYRKQYVGDPYNGATTFTATTKGISFDVNPPIDGAIVRVEHSISLNWLSLAEVEVIAPYAGADITITQQPAATRVVESSTATFSVDATVSPGISTDRVIVQWLKNGTNIVGANSATFTTPVLTPADNNAQYSVRLSVPGVSVVSATALLSVDADTTPPRLLSAIGSGSLSEATVTFSEPVSTATATNAANYSLNGGLTISRASLSADRRSVTLTTSPQVPGASYTVTVNGVRDNAVVGNTVAANSTVNFTAWVLSKGFLSFETYDTSSTAGTAVSVLTAHPNYPNTVRERLYLTQFNTRTAYADDTHEQYGARISGLFIAPSNGLYRFFIRSDDASQLFLNSSNSITSTEPAGKVLIAREDSCCLSYGATNAGGPRVSGDISLNAGQAYYIEGLLKEGTGGDFMQAAVRERAVTGNPPDTEFISGDLLATYANPDGAVITIVQQPQSVSVVEGANVTATFSVVARGQTAYTTNQTALYQWQKNGVDIRGATAATYRTPALTPADSGASYRVVVSIPGASLTSQNAGLTVIRDTIGPSVLSANTYTRSNKVTVVYSEPVSAATATNLSNYRLNAGVTVGSIVQIDPTTVELTLVGPPVAGPPIVVVTPPVTTPPAALTVFNFNEGSGATVRSSDGRLTGTLTSTNTPVTPPIFSTDTPSGVAGDYSLQFTLGKQVVVPDPNKVLALDTNSPNFTVEAWLKFATPAARSVFFYNNGPGGAVSASVFTNRTAFVTTLGIVDQPSAAAIPNDNAWHHMAIVHDFTAKQIRFYVDGVLGDTRTNYTGNAANPGGVTFTRTNQVFYFGTENTGGLQYVGLLDRFRYTAAALTPAQMDTRAATTAQLGTPPVVTPPVVAAPVTNVLISINNTNQLWRYENTGRTNLGTTWKDVAFNDSAWPQGAAILAFETGATAEAIRTQLKRTNSVGTNIITDYFRTHFTFTGNRTNTELRLRHVVDDGLVVYLNGTEVYRFGIPAGTNFTYTNFFTGHENVYEGPFVIPASALVSGDNVIAAEVHQSDLTSSDVVFGLELVAVTSSGTTAPPVVSNTVTNSLIAINNTNQLWRYENTGLTNIAATWKDRTFVDTSWAQGAALLAFETGATAEPIRTQIKRTNSAGVNIVTDYFRTHFTFNGSLTNVQLKLRHVVDDGVVIYLNGTEIHRFFLATNTVITAATVATPSDHENAYEGPFDVSSAALLLGDNVIAAEVHQNNATSSDVVFGLELNAVSTVASTTTPTPTPSPAPLAYEGFNYTAGDIINGKTGGSGWTNAWGIDLGASPTNGAVALAGSLAYTDSKGNSLVTSGGKVLFTGVAGTAQPTRDIAPRGADSTTTWISFLGARQGPVTNGANIYPRGVSIAFFTNATERFSIGNSSGAPSNTWGFISLGSLANLQPTAIPFSQLSLLVVRIDHKPGNDDAYLWVNPALDVEPTIASASAKSTNAFDYGFNRVRPFAGANDAANSRPYGELQADELRIGETFASVTPFTRSSGGGGQPASSLATGLVAYWNFDGNLQDSVASFHGTARGPVPVAYETRAGFGQSLKLNGTNYVEITGSSNTLRFASNSLSISGWFRVDAFDKSWQALLAKGENLNYRIARNSAGNNIAYAGGVAEGANDVPPITNGWHHFVAVTDASRARFGTALYIDGVLRGVNTNAAVLAAGTANLFIGENPEALNRQWNGGIDDVALWNRVLTDTEVSTLYAGGAGKALKDVLAPASAPITVTNGLVAYWSFDGNLQDSFASFHGTGRGPVPVAFETRAGFGQSLKLNGTNYVEITGSSNTLRFASNNLSIAGWFRVDAFDKSWQALLAKGENLNYRIARNSAGNNIAYAGGVAEGANDVPPITNGWHHFVAVTDTSRAKFGTALYVDGVLRGVNTNAAVLAAGTANLFIGENPEALNRQWNGGIDDVALWNRVLTDTEVATLYAGGTGKALSSFLAPATTSAPFSIGLSFGANESNATINATSVAGVASVAQANWNNLSGLSGTNTSVVASSGGTSTPTTAVVKWVSNGTWAIATRGEPNGTNFAVGTPNRLLMEGYLDTGNATTTTVTITNLPGQLTSSGYDLYVYALGGVAGRGGSYRILDAATGTVLNNYVRVQSPSLPTNFIQVPVPPTGTNFVAGNYMVFSGLRASGVIIEATTAGGLGFSGTPRAPINAVQFVALPAQTIRPPSIGLSFGANESNATLTATSAAGVASVAQANWNNLSGLSGTNTTVNTSTGDRAPNTVVQWVSNGTWAIATRGEPNGTNFAVGTPNRLLMEGYLDTGNATTTSITVSNVPSSLTSGGYDVYVYALGGVAGRGGAYRILDAATRAVLGDYVRVQSPSVPTNFIEVPVPPTGTNYFAGNYMVFRSLRASSIIIEATTVSPFGFSGTPRAPINAVQLVAAAATTTIPGPTVPGPIPTSGLILTVTGVQDLATTPNTIAANSNTPVGTDPAVPLDFGQLVNGYQDDFLGTSLNPNWVARGPSTNIYTVRTGFLSVTNATGDPNHLLYELAGYNSTNQEVLARIRITSFGTNADLARAGVGVGVGTNSQGINLLFRDFNTEAGGSGLTNRHFLTLDDARSWGPSGSSLVWTNSTWYWLRLRQAPDLSATGGAGGAGGSGVSGGTGGAGGTGAADIFGKVWLADGTVPEPANFQFAWDDYPGRTVRAGFAGITAGSGGITQFDVDYVLIKAAGLPTIKVQGSTIPVRRNALFVTAATPSNGDLAISNRLATLNYNVTVVADTASATSQGVGRDVIVISSSVGSANLLDAAGLHKFKSLGVPIINWESANYDDLNMTGTAATEFGTIATQTAINIVNAGHPLAAGLPAGTNTIFTSGQTIAFGVPAANAIVVGRPVGIATNAVLFAYEAGDVLFGGVRATERLVGLPLETDSALAANANGIAIFDAALSWVNPPNLQTVIVSNPANTTVVESPTATATFSVDVNGARPFTFQWLKNGAVIAGATNRTVTVPVAFSDSGATFAVRVANSANNVTSGNATLTVTAEKIAPTLVSARTLGNPNQVVVTFSEPVTAVSALNVANYFINNGASVTAITMSDPTTVTLATSTIQENISYSLFVKDVQDRSSSTNTISPNPSLIAIVAPTGASNGPVRITSQPVGLTVLEQSTVNFTVGVAGATPYTYQWRSNGVAIAGATAATLNIASASLSQNGVAYSVVVNNAFSSVTSSNAILNVTADTAGPTLLSAVGSGSMTTVTANFSETLSLATATNTANYAISGGLTVSGAQLAGDRKTVILTTSTQTPGTSYTLVVNGIKDSSAAGNLIAANSQVTFTAWILSRGFLLFEAYDTSSTAGTPVSLLTAHPNYPNNPRERRYMTEFNTRTVYPDDTHEQYGARISGYFIAPSNGVYRFFIRSDDASQLFMNTNSVGSTNPANKVLIAREDSCCLSYGSTNTGGPRVSPGITMVAGQSYYIEGLLKEATGGDFMQTAFRESAVTNTPPDTESISGAFLATFANPDGVSITITRQPQNVSVEESATLPTASFNVAATAISSISTNQVLFFQWQRNGTNILGANASTYTTPGLTPADSGAQYRAVVWAPGLSAASLSAVLTVTRDSTAPTLVSAFTYTRSSNVTVVFSEPVSNATATNTLNYRINNGVTVATAVRTAPNVVELGTSRITPGPVYILTANGIQDTANTPNTVSTNAQILINTADPAFPADFGQVVNGYQDDFAGTSISPNWRARGPATNIYSVGNGYLTVTNGTGDPNHLLYEVAGYNPTNQEVLARIRIKAFGTGDPVRGGIGVAVGTNSSGMNLHFRDFAEAGVTGKHFMFLDDLRSWGPTALPTVWATNTWYWLRLKQAPNTAAGQVDVFGKVWAADGTVPEPADYQITWDRYPTATVLSGFAGITGGSAAGISQFDVDYILIKAAGLPSVQVSGGEIVPLRAGTDTLETTQNTAVTMPAEKLLGNDTGGGGFLSVVGVTTPSAQGATVTLASGNVIYTPRTGFTGTDSFTYTVGAGAARASGTVNVTVRPSTDPSQNGVAITRGEFGVVFVQFSGIPGRRYTIQASLDMRTWADIGSVIAGPNGAINFVDPDGGRFGQRFYRTVSP